MNNELYNKLVDLYAGHELPGDVEQMMETAAADDVRLGLEMTSLRKTVDALQSDPGPESSEETYQRILMKLYARGAAIQPQAPAPAYLQYHLPMQG